MKKSIYRWQILGFIFTGFAGVLLHFLYDWSGQRLAVALFSAVNESIWEHLKLLFFPMFIFAVVESRYPGRGDNNFWCIKLFGIFFGVLSVPVIHYVIKGAFGKVPDWINIVIFFVGVAISFLVELRLFKENRLNCKSPRGAFLILCLIAGVFVIFTFFPPQIPLFQDPRFQ